MPRTLAIGDIHGCLDQLDALLAAIALTPDDHLILLGDLIDRGPNSAGVLTRVVALRKTHHLTIIRGNHEQMMLAARTSQSRFFDWALNGGDATLKSYAGTRASLRDIPNEHWDLVEKHLVDYLETDTHIFIHANACPDMDMKDQPDYMLRWERCDNIAPHISGKIIICGHTPQKSGTPMNKGFAICLDTGAGYGKNLTCLDTTSGRLYQADPAGKISRSHISDYASDHAPD